MPRITASKVMDFVVAGGLSILVIVAPHRQLAKEKVTWRRPLIWLVTDGRPTDDLGYPSLDWQPLVGEIRRLEAGQKLTLFVIGIPPIDDQGQDVLRRLAPERNMIYGEF